MVGRFARGWSVEQHVNQLYASAGASTLDPPGPVALIRALGGAVSIHRGREFHLGDGRLRFLGEDWTVEVHAGLPLHVAALALGRGLADFYVTQAEYAGGRDELAGAILLPEPSIRFANFDRRSGADELARSFGVPESVASARLAKCGVSLRRSGTFARA